MARSVHDGALQLKGVHEGNQGSQAAELDTLVDLSDLKENRRVNERRQASVVVEMGDRKRLYLLQQP